ncbi:alkylmercury lyase [Sphaerochaeta sp. S2]|uniref:DF family (seleno)protein n=1 Tax=Sphaerochaeta sp. S2 TaxID=2798868 RepID=UPI0018E9C592|nr:alkylmercury lyase [Sphaerochaeta sp. S2]MBJ2356260.1 alkylmercury lyase [Sphaerochaeta sp. S2]
MITFLYFNGCPNSQQTLRNLKALQESGDLFENEIEEIEVPDLESAEKTHFQGSPTILYNGIDIYSKKKPEGSHYTCRVYSINGERTGVLSKDYIKKAIYELQQQQDAEPDSAGLSE